MFAYSASFAVKWSPQAKPLGLSFAWLVYFAVKLVRVARVPRFKASKADPCRSALLFPSTEACCGSPAHFSTFSPATPTGETHCPYFGCGSAVIRKFKPRNTPNTRKEENSPVG
ncbi:MAG: hypothetical protein DME24_13545 [Verrucomicrobia bacterium]|nr:MAG: hypothetical protein DME24_13545 [Verrucomicrobiota bacterium]